MLRAGMLALVAASLVGCATAPDTAQRDRADIRLALAQAYFEQGQLAVALEEVQRSLAIDAKHPPAHVLHGLVLMDMQQAESARGSFDRALNLDAQLVSAWHNRAWLSCQQGAWKQANADFDQALMLATGPERVQSLMAQGVCAVRAQSWELAEQRLSQALALDPNHVLARYHWAKAQQAQGQWAQAQWTLQSLNASPQATAESLYLALLGAHQLGDAAAVTQWAQALEQRFPQSPQWDAYQRKLVNDRSR
jgi:type IV pilus assembly protein PilF